MVEGNVISYSVGVCDVRFSVRNENEATDFELNTHSKGGVSELVNAVSFVCHRLYPFLESVGSTGYSLRQSMLR